MKVIVIGPNRYAEWISKDIEFVYCTPSDIADADLIVFTGGADVDPNIYGHKEHRTTSKDTSRDLRELNFFAIAASLNKPMLGICRGAQFLTACQPGGYLIQDVQNHANGNHGLKFKDGFETEITSTHHQMMYPFEVNNYEVLAYANKNLSNSYAFGDFSRLFLPGNKEPEVVYYPDTNCFAIQGHPENMPIGHPVLEKLRSLINIKLFNEKNSSLRVS